MPVIFFNATTLHGFDDLKAQYTPSDKKNLRLMLWVGDGKHGGLTDVERLPGYDVYLCAGWQQNLQDNIGALTDTQTLCILDIHCEMQLLLFHYVYGGCFRSIDSDYHGNTPTLPLTNYSALLCDGGIGRNIEGLNSCIMPYENLYGMLELFAPILPDEQQLQRRWCAEIMDLSKRDDLHPSMVWSSPDLNHPYYAYVKERQKKFEEDQKRRNPAWPKYPETLETHWSALEMKLLLTSFRQHLPSAVQALEKITPHLGRFDEFLSNRIDSCCAANKGCSLNRNDYINEQRTLGEDLIGIIEMKQSILKLVTISLPYGMHAQIGQYLDDRYTHEPSCYGLTLVKVEKPGSA